MGRGDWVLAVQKERGGARSADESFLAPITSCDRRKFKTNPKNRERMTFNYYLLLRPPCGMAGRHSRSCNLLNVNSSITVFSRCKFCCKAKGCYTNLSLNLIASISNLNRNPKTAGDSLQLAAISTRRYCRN